jgi:hypothetical protein
MSVLGDVFGSLESMSLVQLLLAFIACIGYAFAQGSLLPWKYRRIAWAAAVLAAAGFAFESADWTRAAMLLGFAIAGMGSFIALVWLTSRALGLGRNSAAIDLASAESAPAPSTARGAPSRGAQPGDHAHSI